LRNFRGALEKVLSGFALGTLRDGALLPAASGILQSDLRPLADASGILSELSFFPRLREELRRQLTHAPRIMRFFWFAWLRKALGRKLGVGVAVAGNWKSKSSTICANA